MTAETVGPVPASDVEQTTQDAVAAPSEPTGDTPSPVGENDYAALDGQRRTALPGEVCSQGHPATFMIWSATHERWVGVCEFAG